MDAFDAEARPGERVQNCSRGFDGNDLQAIHHRQIAPDDVQELGDTASAVQNSCIIRQRHILISDVLNAADDGLLDPFRRQVVWKLNCLFHAGRVDDGFQIVGEDTICEVEALGVAVFDHSWSAFASVVVASRRSTYSSSRMSRELPRIFSTVRTSAAASSSYSAVRYFCDAPCA